MLHMKALPMKAIVVVNVGNTYLRMYIYIIYIYPLGG
jgi:hypothetical protein